MKSFNRIFVYIWPQWYRLVVVFVTAMIVAVLLSLSFVTIIPLLKLMMGQEGLHGWVDRQICKQRYEVEFYEPEIADTLDPNQINIAYYLRVTGINEDSPLESSGINVQDIIIGAGNSLAGGDVENVLSSTILSELAYAQGDVNIPVQYRRRTEQGLLDPQVNQIEFYSGTRPFYLDTVERIMSSIPRPQGKEDKTRAMGIIIILMVIFTVGRCVARFYQQYIGGKLVQSAIANLRQEVFVHVINMPISFFENESPSDAVSRLVRDTSELAIGLKTLFGKALREPLSAFSLLIVAMLIDLKITLIFICSVPFITVAIAQLGRKIKRATRKSLVSWSVMLAKLKETFGAIKVVKVYNRQEYENTNFDRINQNLLKQTFRIAKTDAATSPIMEVLGMITGGIALLYGAHWVASDQISPASFLTLIATLGAAAGSVRKSSDIWNKIQQANAAAERVYTIIDRELEVENPNAFELPPLKYKLEFKDIVFRYPGADRDALNKINICIEAGRNVALVGPNGSGKTTLANLIPRFYDPSSGQVLIDGKDIRESTFSSLRNQIGMVTQNVVTFNDTIAANISYGKPGATMEEIIAAAKRSFAHEFIEPLPNGYNTIIGEESTGLSGGQMQRIVIARAILKNPAILIFDEATSQVDAESEAKIHKAIEEVMRDRTSIIIAHRFSTVISADVIVVMDKGQIIAQGQHEQLIRDCQLYQNLYETQLIQA